MFERLDDLIVDWLSDEFQFTGGGAIIIAVHRTRWRGEERHHLVVEVDDEAFLEDGTRKIRVPGEQLYDDRRLFVCSVSVPSVEVR